MSTPIDIFGKFLNSCTIGREEVESFKRIGSNTVHIRLKNRKELVFTYISSNKWCIESMDLYRSKKREK